MILKFTLQANLQLHSILDYIRERNPRATDHVRARIERACGQISRNPQLGRRQDVEGVRRKIINPGGYLIYYRVIDSDRIIEMLAISHPSRQRPYDDA